MEAEEKVAEIETTGKRQKRRKPFLKAKSMFGSSFHIPNMDAHVAPNSPFSSFEIPWDRWVVVPEQWRDNPYLQAAVEAGKVVLDESPGAPKPAPDMPTDLPSEHREWLRTFLYGPYTDGFKQLLKDWRDRAITLGNPGRPTVLQNSVLPVLRAAYQLESEIQNRDEVLKDIKAGIDFIVSREWENIPERERIGPTRSR